jgi:Fic-DOC domain mobile mystery protein B
VSGFIPELAPGATPLDPNEIVGLIPRFISTQGELNFLEQENILEAMSWARKKKGRGLFTDSFLRELHKRMFKAVWKWAGQYRRSGKNIGVFPERIPEEIQKLCQDTQYWIKQSTYPWDELGARFHHRLVWIHAFPNGNGRHARLLTDLMLEAHQQEPLTWGGARAETAGSEAVRMDYLNALSEADNRKFGRLIRFLRS